MRSKSLEFNGEVHTVAEWDRIRCFPRGTINIRLGNGWSVKRAISQPINGKRVEKRITINGVSRTLKQWLKIKRMSANTFRSRVNTLGWSKRRALCTPLGVTVGKHRRKQVTFNGETHSMKDWSLKLGLSVSAVHHRIKNGMSVEDAVTAKKNEINPQRHFVTALGKTYTLAEWSRRTGIPDRAILHRLENGWVPEDAVTIPIHEKKRIMITVNGDTACMATWEKRMGYSRGLITQRMQHGWDPTDAVLVDPAESKNRSRRRAFAALGIVS